MFDGSGQFPQAVVTNVPSTMPRLKGFRYPCGIIGYAVWADHRFALSTTDVKDLLTERVVVVIRETVRKWVNRLGRHFASCIKRDRPGAADKWHADELVIPIGGVKFWCVLSTRMATSSISACKSSENAKAANPYELWLEERIHRAHKELNNRKDRTEIPEKEISSWGVSSPPDALDL